MPYLPPSFFIIGERKCATSSLYRYLIDHPQILPCRIKEPQFFSKPWWYRTFFAARYRSLFPDAAATEMKMEWLDLDVQGKIVKEELIVHRDPNAQVITGEASANTFAQVPPMRLYQSYPDVKLILCLRHPVERAYSHYRMLQRFVQEGRRIPFRPTDFFEDFKEDISRRHHGRQGYFAGLSFYAERLKNWLEVFGKEQIFIVRTEDLLIPGIAKDVLSDLHRFLEVPEIHLSGVLQRKINQAAESKLDSGMRARLFAFYSDDTIALETLTGRKFDWNP